MSPKRRKGADRQLCALRVLGGTGLAAVALLSLLALATGFAAAAGPPFPSPVANRSVYDPDEILKAATVRTAEQAADTVQKATGLEAIVFVQRSPAGLTSARATTDAAALAEEWQVDRGVVLLLDVASGDCAGEAGLARGRGITASDIDDAALVTIETDLERTLRSCSPDTAVVVGLSNLTVALVSANPGGLPGGTGPAASINVPVPSINLGSPFAIGQDAQVGPPFPNPVDGQYVYDQAGVFRPDTIAKVQAQIQDIRDRTGAEVVVYSQVKGADVDEATAEADAQALMDQWGVGRRGFDDGLVILFDLDLSKEHGQVQLYAGPGYRATFLSNQERQAIFENDMLPLLREGDLDGALLVAMQKVDANATPEHAATLERARQVNAVVGLVGAPTVLILLIGWAAWSWLRYGRDPSYLDDPSIYMPAPPADLTAAAGALVYEGQSSRLTLTTAMLDLASRDELAFEPEEHRLGRDKLGIDIRDANVDDPRVGLNRRKPIGPAEVFALQRLDSLATTDENGVRHIDSTGLLGFGKSVEGFDTRLETYATDKGWFRERPRDATSRWTRRGFIELIGGIALGVLAANLPSDGLLLVAVGLVIAGVATIVIARVMPARTLPGATIRAMLAAYRRTLQKTLEQSRSMDQVVQSRAVPWLETPDQAVVWGVALGLRKDVEEVMQRTASDLQQGRADPSLAYLPRWYGATGSPGGGSGGGGGLAPGLFAASAIPNFGGMMSAIGTIGDSPSSSGGGFGGGGSGGGGGGAGGGF